MITLLAHEPAAGQALFSLGFGLLVFDALRDLDAPAGPVAEVDVRRVGAEDLDQILPLERALQLHLESAPIYLSPSAVPDAAEREKWLSDPSHVMWLACRDGVPVGALGTEPTQQLVLPTSSKGTLAITFAYAEGAARRSGIATALLARALEWARAEGYDRCSVDFESANLEASGFWFKSGFRPVCRSLARRLDERTVQQLVSSAPG